MKTLYLIRHAKSSWKHDYLADFDRPLNKRGKHDAPLMGRRLKQHGMPGLFLSSPAKRAIRTAEVIANETGYPPEQIRTDEAIYLAGEKSLLKIICRVEDRFDSIALFGHNPGFTLLANLLSNESVENIPTCGIFCIGFNIDTWREVAAGKGKMIFFDYPKRHVKDE